MSEFEDTLNAILSNPDAMNQVMQLAQSIGGSGHGTPKEGGAAEGDGRTGAGAGNGPPSGGGTDAGGGGPLGVPGNLGNLGDLLGGLDPKMLSRLLPLLGEMNQGNDERMQLLYALRPFLKPERAAKVDRAAKAARLLSMGRKLLSAIGDEHV